MQQDMQSQKKNRSTPYPQFDLESSIEVLTKLDKQLGGSTFSRESAAKALGYSGLSGISAGKIAALVHFGLLSRSGNVYKITDLAIKILRPINDDEKQKALVDSLKNPAVFSKIINDFSGKSLPGMLSNVLQRAFTLTSGGAIAVDKNFRQSAIFTNTLVNGVLQLGSLNKYDTVPDVAENSINEQIVNSKSSNFTIDGIVINQNTNNSTPTHPIIPEDSSVDIVSYPLAKNIIVSHPLDFTLKDVKLIKSYAEYLISRLGGDQT